MSLLNDLLAQAYCLFGKSQGLSCLCFIEELPWSAPVCLVAVVALRVDLRSQERSTLGEFLDLCLCRLREASPFQRIQEHYGRVVGPAYRTNERQCGLRGVLSGKLTVINAGAPTSKL